MISPLSFVPLQNCNSVTTISPPLPPLPSVSAGIFQTPTHDHKINLLGISRRGYSTTAQRRRHWWWRKGARRSAAAASASTETVGRGSSAGWLSASSGAEVFIRGGTQRRRCGHRRERRPPALRSGRLRRLDLRGRGRRRHRPIMLAVICAKGVGRSSSLLLGLLLLQL